MKRLLRMERSSSALSAVPPQGVRIVRYETERHRQCIPAVYAESFGEAPWAAGWDTFEEFDPRGLFLAVDTGSDEAVGFVISFRRRDFGYVSVVAVLPAYRRRGIATALLAAAIDYLRSLGLASVRIDAYEKDLPAVRGYEQAGFRVVEVLSE